MRNCEAEPGSENCHVLLTTTEKLALKTSFVLSLHSQAYLHRESSQIPILSPAGLLSLNQGEGKQQTAKGIKTLSP